MAQIRVARVETRGIERSAELEVEKLLSKVFPVETTEQRTRAGNLSTKSVMEPVLMALGANGFTRPKRIRIEGTSYGLESDFLRPGVGELGVIAGESQLALRECVSYDFLKHAALQRQAKCSTSIELVAAAGLARDLNNACAEFDWALAMLDHLVMPAWKLRIALVGLEFVR